VRDGDGALLAKWAVFRCLFGELDYGGRHYILDEGRFYEVETGYLAELNEYVGSIPTPAMQLPVTSARTLEDEYNEAAAARPDRLLLDKKTIRPSYGTTNIGICDLLTAAGEVVHVKRKLGSSDLSHLFSQGYVSAETVHAGPDFRSAVRAKVEEEAASQGKDAATFSIFFKEPFRPGRLTVVYAVLADWAGRALEDRLPFFSKVNLRHHGRQLRRMGFDLAFAPVQTSA
jgi:uncharacterized protein (TIGR04141 family)